MEWCGVKKTFRQRRCETAALFSAPGKVTSTTRVKQQIQSSVGRGPFLLQTQLMSHTSSPIFMTNRHMTKLVLSAFYQVSKSDDSRGVSPCNIYISFVFQLLSSHAPSHGVNYVCRNHPCCCLSHVCYMVAYDYLNVVPMVLLTCFPSSL